MKLTRPHKLPAYYEITFYGDNAIRFDDIFWTLDSAKEAVRDDILASWDDDISYSPTHWRKTDPDRWSYYAGDTMYDIRKVQPESQS